MPQGLLNPFCFPEILKANLDNIKFPRVCTLLKYVADFLLCSPSQAFSQEDRIHVHLHDKREIGQLLFFGYK